MLSLRQIIKDYGVNDSKVRALNGVSLDFRENEFVSILGPSGCGKTTLLNIIGGLDQYTSGDLIINGISTKEYTDSDWDTYRNHSIGFVFQSYNLIPHQTILANVELALTLSGISRAERRERATEALRQVGLEDQIHKRPNQLSGGQMQRVAIARALVNDPDILLADEPTGALDTQTSVQIMDILKEISKKKLIIMVTHNPELAEEYSSRIIRVLDGQVVSDSNPFVNEAIPQDAGAPEETEKKIGFFARQKEKKARKKAALARQNAAGVKKGKKSMSFLTALSLSLNNLMTKKTRTFMTSFAGSIGIIGIALILSVSSGVNNYINSVQRDTLASYPIQLDAETVDMQSLLTTLMNASGDDELDHDLDKVYENLVLAELFNSLMSVETNTNDLVSFKKYLESTDKFDAYLSAVQYAYDFNWSIFMREGNSIAPGSGKIVESNVAEWLSDKMSGGMGSTGSSSMMMSSSFNPWQEMLAPVKDDDNSLVNNVLKDQYELIDGGHWPEAANEVVLIVNERNEISDLALFALGLRTEEYMKDMLLAGMTGKEIDTSNQKSWTYDEIKQMEFRLLLATECYEYDEATGTYKDMSLTAEDREILYNDPNKGFTIKVVGVIRPRADATGSMLTGTIGYTSALAKEALNRTLNSEMLADQKNNPTTDIITGLPFKSLTELTDAEKVLAVQNHLARLSEDEQKEILSSMLVVAPTDEEVNAVLATMDDTTQRELVESAWAYLDEEYRNMLGSVDAIMQNETYKKMALQAIVTESLKNDQKTQLKEKSLDDLYAMMDDTKYLSIYESDLFPKDYSESNYENNLFLLGDVKEDSPKTIYLYADSFENKDKIAELIQEYNKGVPEAQQITYTDMVALLMSSITTIVNAITYVLIAFVGISLIVSSIMIGIITYISVLERTKEIGILRAIGASKKDIRRVFNAETLIIGFVSGMIGIIATLFFNIIINIILFHFTGIAALKATLPVVGAIVLVGVSMLLTFVAGLFPSGFAAKRNPVEALRSE